MKTIVQRIIPNPPATLLLLASLALPMRGFAQTPPTITKPPADTFAFTGDKTSVTVTASGSTPLQYQWLLNDEAVSAANKSDL